MPDEPVTPPPDAPAKAATELTEPKGKAPVAEPDEELGAGGTKALAAERQARREAEQWRKENEALVTEAKERQEKDKTEAQKLADQLAAERTGRTSAEQKLLRYEVAAAKGVPPNLVRFLHGDSKEDIEEAADALLQEMGEGKPAMPERPQERTATGTKSNAEEAMSAAQLAALVLDD